jgi:hypothetical protein
MNCGYLDFEISIHDSNCLVKHQKYNYGFEIKRNLEREEKNRPPVFSSASEYDTAPETFKLEKKFIDNNLKSTTVKHFPAEDLSDVNRSNCEINMIKNSSNCQLQ